MLQQPQQVFRLKSVWNYSDLYKFLAIVLGFGLLFGACSACEGPPPRSKPWRDFAASAPIVEPTAGLQAQGKVRETSSRGALRIHLDADPGSLNPLASPSQWTQRIMMDTVFETLIRYQRVPGQEEPGYQSGLARTYTLSPGGREIRFLLEESATFHDGKAVTALDVQFSIESAMLKRGGAPHHRTALSDVMAVEIVGRNAVRIRLEKANGFVLRQLAAIPILPEHIYRERLSQKAGEWVGSGPYKLDQVSAKGIELVRNDNYWGPAPALARVSFVRQRDAAVALRDAKGGEMDILPELIAEHRGNQFDATAGTKTLRALELSRANFSYIVLDNSRPPFDDRRVRRAVAHLVGNPESLAKPGSRFRKVAGPIWRHGPGDAESTALTYDPKEAQRLMVAAGWQDEDGDGVRSRDGSRLMITVLTTEDDNSSRDAVLSALRKAGFVLDLRIGSAAVLRNRLNDGEFDLAFATWSGAADRNLRPLLGSRSKQNFSRFQNPIADELLAQIESAALPADRRPKLRLLADLLRREMPIVALPAPYSLGLIHKRVRGAVPWNGWLSIRDLDLEPIEQ